MKIERNPDCNNASDMVASIAENGGHCLCAIEKTEDTKCPCKEFRNQAEGVCNCGLFIKKGAKNES